MFRGKITHKVGTWQQPLLEWAGTLLTPQRRSVQSCFWIRFSAALSQPLSLSGGFTSAACHPSQAGLFVLYAPPHPRPRAIVYLLEAYDGDIWSRDRGDLYDQSFINGREILIVGTDGRNLTLTKL